MAVSGNFNPTDVLNQLFPDEASLSQLEVVQAKLAQDERELQGEIDALQEELKRDQDPIQDATYPRNDLHVPHTGKASESEAVVIEYYSYKRISRSLILPKNLILSHDTLKAATNARWSTPLTTGGSSEERAYAEVAQVI
ncbi:hypothetical protein BU15DRAFT_72282 [Melanogaster broomeanus]|nr:hypothetical protein BU15DRAFT_72282 [Melanogaster broomeanus]